MIRSRTDRLLVVALVGVAAGALPPWLAANPWYDGVEPAVQYAGQASGMETWGMATLPLAVLAVGVLVWREGRVATTSAALVGASTIAVAAEVAYQGATTPWLLPGPGVVLSVASGVAVVALVARTRPNPER